MTYQKENLGELLKLPTFNHYYQIPIILYKNNDTTTDRFIICFKKELNLYAVDMTHDLGHTIHFESATFFSKDDLLAGIAAVPLAYLGSIHILAYPGRLTQVRASSHLKNLVALYLDEEETLHFLKTSKNYGDHVTRYQLEAQRLIKQGKAPDLFRYTSRSQVPKETLTLATVSHKDYDFIVDFHPFLRAKRDKAVLSLPALYQDPKTKETVKVEIMGWYIKDQQLKIRWKPKYMRKRRWRSSRISVDITSGDYFFQGQIYKTKKAPVFLKHLNLHNKIPQSYQGELEKAYQQFLAIVDEQKRLALLRQVQVKNGLYNFCSG